MSSGLSATVDPIKLADARAHISGKLPLKTMGRLRVLCLDTEAQARVSLHFERSSDQGLRRMHGRISVRLHVACQRCLERMTLVLKAEPSLIVVKAGEHTDLLEHETEVLVADKPVALSKIVEDELLLAMPMIPMHDVSECPAAAHMAAQRNSDQTPANPFSVLGRLKQIRK
ncbi:MAG: YceD family protein [Acidiferrobacterales bacterium]